MSGALTLLTLRLTRYWIGCDPPDAIGLQFEAKLLELLMQFSLAEVMLCIIRAVATPEFVPLGLLSGASQTMPTSHLWSLDHLSNFTSDVFKGRLRRRICIIIVTTILLITSVLVRLSTATPMVPGPGCSRTSDSTRYYDDMGSIFPTNLSLPNGHNMRASEVNDLGLLGLTRAGT